MTVATLSPSARTLAEWRWNPRKFVSENFGVEPDAWQAGVLDVFPSQDPDKLRIALQSCAGTGKAQPKTTLIDTPAGVRAMGDLRPGDEVFSADGSPTRVRAVYDRGMLSMRRVVFDDGSETVCCGEHLWRVRGRTERRHGTWSTITTDEIVGRRVREPSNKNLRRQWEIPQQGAAQYARATLPVDPYVMGVWLGDGSKNSGRYTGKDAEVRAEIERRGYSVGPDYREVTRSIYGIVGHLRALGVVGTNSQDRFIPQLYLHASVQQRTDLLRGLMDTDGCIDARLVSMEFSSTSRRLADGVVWLVRSLGGTAWLTEKVKKASYRDEQGAVVPCRDCYRVRVTLPFCPFTITRKAARWRKTQSRYLTRYIDRIEFAEPADAVCIEVEHQSACYLTNDFIVTHNSAVLAWCGLNFLSCYGDTREHPKGAAVSITRENLRDFLWAEIAKFRSRSPFLMALFEMNQDRIYAKEHPETWFITARGFPKDADQDTLGRTLSGLHSPYVLFLIDEAGAMPAAIGRAAEQARSTADRFFKILMAGNPVTTDGLLYAAATTMRHLYVVVCVTGDPDDPLRSPRVDVAWAREQIETYGRDNPWVMVYILGQFPKTGINTLLGPDDVAKAMKRVPKIEDFGFMPRVLCIDVARFGDDRTVFTESQGICVYPQSALLHVLRGARTDEIAARAAFLNERSKGPFDAICIDSTGGWGAGVEDALRLANLPVIAVNSSSKAGDPRYFNTRSQMHFKAAEFVKNGGCLPDDPELAREAVVPKYFMDKGKLRIEEKEQIKKLLGFSPDKWDSLCLRFAVEIMPKSEPESPLDRYRGQVNVRRDRDEYYRVP